MSRYRWVTSLLLLLLMLLMLLIVTYYCCYLLQQPTWNIPSPPTATRPPYWASSSALTHLEHSISPYCHQAPILGQLIRLEAAHNLHRVVLEGKGGGRGGSGGKGEDRGKGEGPGRV